MSTEDLNLDELQNIEKVNNYMQNERAKEGFVNPKSIDSLVGSGQGEGMAAEIKNRQYEYAATGVVSEKSLDNIAASDNIASLEAAVKYAQTERAKEGFVNPKSIDSLVGSGQAESMAAEIKNRQYEYAASGSINEGSADNVAVSGNYDKNARIRQLVESAGAKAYFTSLAVNPTITSNEEFKAAVAGGIRSNEVLDKFFNSYCENLSSLITASKGGKLQEENQGIDPKQTVEGYLNVYSNLIYELKAQDAVVDFNKLKFPDELKDDLLSAQKSLCESGEVFSMPIPSKCQGHEPMEVMGDAASVINLINGYTPQGYIGRVLGDNPNYVPAQQEEAISEDSCQ